MEPFKPENQITDETILHEPSGETNYEDNFMLFKIEQNLRAFESSGVEELELYRFTSVDEDFEEKREASRQALRNECFVTGFETLPVDEEGPNDRKAYGFRLDHDGETSLLLGELYVEEMASGKKIATYVYKAKRVREDYEQFVVDRMIEKKSEKRYGEFIVDPVLRRVNSNGA